jgi:integrase/recombinase XerD
LAGGTAMLIDTVGTYLAVRRAVGFQLKIVERYLRSYADFATDRGDQYVTGKTAIEWAALGRSASQRANRLRVLIRFAHFARAEDRNHEVPPDHVFCRHRQRRTPYICTDDEIKRLLWHAARLGPPGTLRGDTYQTLFGLLAATGLRISEALSLRLQDITPDGLVIRETKFRKTRLAWIHESVAVALQQYLRHRQPFARTDHVFVSSRGGGCLGYAIVAKTFQDICQAADVHGSGVGPRPRLHDLRHRFAVKALESCPDTRDRVSRHMLALSTYMGHAHLESTYWYLDSTPQLMTDIAAACESFVQGATP